MELKILIPMGDINKLIDSGDKLFDKNYDSRVVDVVRESEVEFGFGVQFSGVTSLFFIVLSSLLFGQNSPNALGDISNYLFYY